MRTPRTHHMLTSLLLALAAALATAQTLDGGSACTLHGGGAKGRVRGALVPAPGPASACTCPAAGPRRTAPDSAALQPRLPGAPSPAPNHGGLPTVGGNLGSVLIDKAILKKPSAFLTPRPILEVREFGGDMAIWDRDRCIEASEGSLMFRWTTDKADADGGRYEISGKPFGLFEPPRADADLLASGLTDAPQPGHRKYFWIDSAVFLDPTVSVYYVRLFPVADAAGLPTVGFASAPVTLTLVQVTSTTTFTDPALLGESAAPTPGQVQQDSLPSNAGQRRIR